MGVAGRKNRRPAMKLISLRVPYPVFDYYNSFPSYSAEMRKVLVDEATSKIDKAE